MARFTAEKNFFFYLPAPEEQLSALDACREEAPEGQKPANASCPCIWLKLIILNYS